MVGSGGGGVGMGVMAVTVRNIQNTEVEHMYNFTWLFHLDNL